MFRDSHDRSTNLDRLSCQRVDRPCRPDLELVQDHVPEALVVDDSDVDVRSKLLAGNPGVHWLVAIVVVSCSFELFTKVINCSIVFGKPEINRLWASWDQGAGVLRSYWKGVASCARPCIAPAFPAILSTNIPIVIRLGNAWGFIITSGCIPLSVNGMSTAGHF